MTRTRRRYRIDHRLNHAPKKNAPGETPEALLIDAAAKRIIQTVPATRQGQRG